MIFKIGRILDAFLTKRGLERKAIGNINWNAIVGSLWSNSKLHSWIVGIVIVAHVFVIGVLPGIIKLIFQVVFPLGFVFLIIWGMINVFVAVYDRSIVHGKVHYSMRLVEADELIGSPNFNEYTKLFFLFFVGQYSFDLFRFPGVVMYLSLAIFLSVRSFIVLYRDYERTHAWTRTKIVNLFLAICLLVWSKNTYSRISGAESIGSFFEKTDYRTKYYVNMFPEASKSESYRLPAMIHVYDGSDKVISIERVYFDNGGFLYFEDCQVEIGEKTYCTDQRGRRWYIELTDLKVE
jgi:hypothetical protein